MSISSSRKENARLRRAIQMVQAQNMSITSALKAYDAQHTEGVDVASAAQIDLRAIGGAFAQITGTTSITSIVEQEAGQIRRVIFADSLILVHNATSFILPGEQPIATVEGDSAEFVSLGGGNWKCTRYTRGGGPGSPTYSGLWTNYITNLIGTDGVDYVYNNGSSGVGATITFTAVGAKMIGADTPALGDTILYNRSDGLGSPYGGIYEVTRKGTGAVTEIWTRSPMMDTANKFVGATVFVIIGGLCAGVTIGTRTSWGFTSDEEPVVGTTDCQFNLVNYLSVNGDVFFDSFHQIPSVINPSVVTRAMLAPSAACSVIGRSANSAGDPADIAIANGTFLARQSNVVDDFFLSDFTSDDLAIADIVPFADASESGVTNSTTVSRLLGFASSSICEGRLTLTSGTSVTTADVTGATSVLFTPHIGDRITIFDGTRHCLYIFTELTLALGTLTSGLPYDVFVFNNAGTLTLEALAWSTTTARATALVRQNGAWYKTGALTRRWLGAFYTTSTTTTEDSLANRYLFNAHNRVLRPMSVMEGTDTWGWSTASYQQARATATNQLGVMIGLSEDAVEAHVSASVVNSGATARNTRSGIGIDSTTVNSATLYDSINVSSTQRGEPRASYVGFPGLGKHTLVWLEQGAGADTQTWSGDAGGNRQCGIIGKIMC